MILGVLAEYGLPPDLKGDDSDLDDVESFYRDRGGRFELLVSSDGAVLGTVGLLPLADGACELRKMYFRPELRGNGWGKAVLDRMIRAAIEDGYRVMQLKTATVLVEAIGLYERFGFQPATPGAAPRCDRAFVLMLSDYIAPELVPVELHEIEQ